LFALLARMFAVPYACAHVSTARSRCPAVPAREFAVPAEVCGMREVWSCVLRAGTRWQGSGKHRQKTSGVGGFQGLLQHLSSEVVLWWVGCRRCGVCGCGFGRRFGRGGL
jgi:hypothetical protein